MFMDNAMRVSVDYNRYRDQDYNYFNDFTPKVGTQVDNQLQQSLKAGFYQQNWNPRCRGTDLPDPAGQRPAAPTS